MREEKNAKDYINAALSTTIKTISSQACSVGKYRSVHHCILVSSILILYI